MSDDIVTRLRMFSLDDGTDALNILLAECIDEIEYLRTDSDKASALIAKLVELLVPYSVLMNKDEQKMLIKAAGGE